MFKKRLYTSALIFIIALVSALSIGAFSQKIAQAADEAIFSSGDIQFSFVVVGCNRVDKSDIEATAPSTANIEQLNRTFKEIAELSPPPKFLFFAGDLVYGYTPDANILENQLKGWRQLYENSPLASKPTELIPIPGNHEVQDDKKVAYEAAEKTWLKVMAPYLKRGGNGPNSGGEDKLKTDQSFLTYSFDYQGTHFVLLNTDPVGKDWSVPVNWISKDLAAARQNKVKHIFAIGHKPAHGYPANLLEDKTINTEDDLGKVYPELRDEFWTALVSNHSEAMLAAHNHVYYRAKGPNGNTWQIIAGNGGSKLEKVADQKSMNFFGFTVVNVLKNGRVNIVSYGRDIPANGYLAPSSENPTTIRDRLDITWE
ncbi:hypothetical protein BCD67_15060 [Oscillatoriales cyanobacterium USR001]|nr:hypothetical protein BCD67_15060 [Oscillatoriales cyanobacterium USR001]